MAVEIGMTGMSWVSDPAAHSTARLQIYLTDPLEVSIIMVVESLVRTRTLTLRLSI